MVHYWISVFAFAGRQTLTFLGKSQGGILLDIIVLLLTFYRLFTKHGWAGMKIKVKETILEGLLIVSVGAIFVYLCQFIAAPPAIQSTTIQAVAHERGLRIEGEKSLADCRGQLRTQATRSQLLGEQKDAQQLTINAQQGQLDTQQNQFNNQEGVVSQCVVSLGKMNPKVREEIVVTLIPYAVTNEKGNIINKASFLSRYQLLMLVTTNETELRFHGIVKCDKPFDIGGSPTIQGTSQTTFTTTSPHVRLVIGNTR